MPHRLLAPAPLQRRNQPRRRRRHGAAVGGVARPRRVGAQRPRARHAAVQAHRRHHAVRLRRGRRGALLHRPRRRPARLRRRRQLRRAAARPRPGVAAPPSSTWKPDPRLRRRAAARSGEPAPRARSGSRDRRRHGPVRARSTSGRAGLVGSESQTSAPLVGRFAARAVPPWATAMLSTTQPQPRAPASRVVVAAESLEGAGRKPGRSLCPRRARAAPRPGRSSARSRMGPWP